MILSERHPASVKKLPRLGDKSFSRQPLITDQENCSPNSSRDVLLPPEESPLHSVGLHPDQLGLLLTVFHLRQPARPHDEYVQPVILPTLRVVFIPHGVGPFFYFLKMEENNSESP